MSPLCSAVLEDVSWPGEDAEPHELLAVSERLDALRANLSEPHWLPGDVDSNKVDWSRVDRGLRFLAEFTALRAKAGSARIRGKVAAALRLEARAEESYRSLPKGWRF